MKLTREQAAACDTFHVESNVVFTKWPHRLLTGEEAWRNGLSLTVTVDPEVPLTRDGAAADIAAKLNACHGLDLPADVEPGILAEVVTATRSLVGFLQTYPHPMAVDINTGEVADLLAKLSGVPVSPPEPEPPAVVIFRKFTGKDGEVYALFPEIPADSHPNHCQTYAHNGQHGSGLAGAVPGSRLATPEEYAPLKAELERIGYVLDVRKKVTPSQDAKRRAAMVR